MVDQTEKKTNTPNSAEEWKILWQQFARQVRRDAARLVGETPDASWSEIGKKAGETSRQGAAKVVNAPQDADWETIGQQVEKNVRTGIASIVGATPDADWTVVGQTVDTRFAPLQTLLHPSRRSSSATKDDELVDPWKYRIRSAAAIPDH